MIGLQTIKAWSLAVTGTIVLAVVAAGCGSSHSPEAAAGAPMSGSGLTEPTSPHGPRTSGGIVYFTEIPNQSPNYIFPMYSFAVCGTPNVNQFPDNVTSYSAPDPQTFVLHFNKPCNPQWVLYNELSQLTPPPLDPLCQPSGV